ncbi:MAG: ABC transporter ATP-binding protein [Alsobacter sp.]
MRLEVRNVSVRLGGRPILREISLNAQPGELLAVIGPNGSGKSTLLRVLAGLQPSDGEVQFDEGARPPRGIGFMPQDVSSRSVLTVLETVLLGRLEGLGWRVADTDLRAASTTLADLGLTSLAGRSLGELSGGQRQLVFLAQALVAQPTVLLLDEPISALDIRNQMEVLHTVERLTRERRLTSIVVLHDLNAAARHGHRVAMIQDGRIVACGSPADVLSPAAIWGTFGVRTTILTGPKGRPVIVPLDASDPT